MMVDYCITHHCQSLHRAVHRSIHHLPSIIQPAFLIGSLSESASSGLLLLPPPFLPPMQSLTQLLSWKVTSKRQDSRRTCRGRREGGPSAPNRACFRSFPLSAPGSHPRPNHSLLNNSACSSAII